jgi:large subunit ribosomal protein L32
MAVPARRTSKQKKRQRRGHIKLQTPNLQFDATNGEYRLSHHVSPKGFLQGRVKCSNKKTQDAK